MSRRMSSRRAESIAAGCREYFGYVHRANLRAPAIQPAAHVHQTTHVGGHDNLRAASIDRVKLVFEDASGDVRILDRKQPSKSAAGFRPLKLDDFYALYFFEEPPRFGSKVQLSKQVTRLMQRDSSVK